jgi:hypothetical protein
MTFSELYNLAKSQPDRMVSIHNSKPFSLHKFADLQKHTIDNVLQIGLDFRRVDNEKL